MRRLLGAVRKGLGERRLALQIARARRRPRADSIELLVGRLDALSLRDAAESLLKHGLEHLPDNPRLIEIKAMLAHDEGRHEEALAAYRRLSELQPDNITAWCGISANARELALFEEANAAINEALRQSPEDISVLLEAAWVKEYCGAFAEAAERWRRLVSHPYADDDWHLALARNLIALEQFDEVESILTALHAPDDVGSARTRRKLARQWCDMAHAMANHDRSVLARHAAQAVSRFGEQAFAIRHVAETTADVDVARAALKRIVESSTADLEAQACYVLLLLRSELVDDAERQVKIGLSLAPAHEAFHALQRLIAIRRQDWDTAYASAVAFAEKNPHDVTASYLVDRMRELRQVEEAQVEEATSRDTVRLAPTVVELCDEPATAQLLQRFESFGRDCEFGLVQRRYGAEPLGLLRWSETDMPTLMAALAVRFEGMGHPDNTELFVGRVGDIQVRDRRWNFAMHTFLHDHEVSLEVLHPKMCRRTAFLRDKLLEDLGGGGKTLVFKSDLVDSSELLALHDALLAYGPNRLLNVRHASGTRDLPPGPPGSVRAIRPGLFVGHLSRVAQLADLAFDEWVEVCRGVEQLRAGADPGDPSSAMASAA